MLFATLYGSFNCWMTAVGAGCVTMSLAAALTTRTAPKGCVSNCSPAGACLVSA